MAEMGTTAAGKKRKKSYYIKSAKRSIKRELNTGMKGVLITCSDLESMCVREAYDVLNEVADGIYGPENLGSDENSNDDDCDIEKKIQQEVKVLKDKKERRFQSLFSGLKNSIFIRCNDEIDPCLLVHRLLCSARDTQVQKTRFCSRIIPVTKVCGATLNEIKKHSLSVLSEDFHGTDPQPREFAVRCKCRNNNVIKQKDVIDLLASVVTDDGTYHHVVNLDTPELVIFVVIIKNVCCMSVLKDFVGLKQYNIQSLYTSNNDPAESKSTDGKRKNESSDQQGTVKKTPKDTSTDEGKDECTNESGDQQGTVKKTPKDTSTDEGKDECTNESGDQQGTVKKTPKDTSTDEGKDECTNESGDQQVIVNKSTEVTSERTNDDCKDSEN